MEWSWHRPTRGWVGCKPHHGIRARIKKIKNKKGCTDIIVGGVSGGLIGTGGEGVKVFTFHAGPERTNRAAEQCQFAPKDSGQR